MTETQLRQTESVPRNKLQGAYGHALEEISHLVARCESLEEERLRHGKSGNSGVNGDVIGGGGHDGDDESCNEDENGNYSLNENEPRLPNLELDHVKVVEETRFIKQVKLLTRILQAANEECHSLRGQVKEKELLHLEVQRLECQFVTLQEKLADERTKVALLESGGGGGGAGAGAGGEDDGIVREMEWAMMPNEAEGVILLNRIHPSSLAELLIKILFDTRFTKTTATTASEFKQETQNNDSITISAGSSTDGTTIEGVTPTKDEWTAMLERVEVTAAIKTVEFAKMVSILEQIRGEDKEKVDK
ncbi:hypothetical protein HDU76_006358, partial [Blyttiomyces sp. JEL0837]